MLLDAQVGHLYRAGAGRHVEPCTCSRCSRSSASTTTIAKKAIHAKGGIDISQKVARGEAEIGVTLISEIVPVKGARMAGPLPEALQLWTVYTSAIPASSTQPDGRARLRQGADLAGDGGALDGRRLRAAEVSSDV